MNKWHAVFLCLVMQKDLVRNSKSEFWILLADLSKTLTSGIWGWSSLLNRVCLFKGEMNHSVFLEREQTFRKEIGVPMSDLKRGFIRLRPSIVQSMAWVSEVLLGAATTFVSGTLVDCLQNQSTTSIGWDLSDLIVMKSVLDPWHVPSESSMLRYIGAQTSAFEVVRLWCLLLAIPIHEANERNWEGC